MGAIIRPIGKEDLKKSYGMINTPISKAIRSGTTVQSEEIFGDAREGDKGDYLNDCTFYRKGVIKLTIPVLNFFATGGAQTNVLKKILDCPNFEAIAEGSDVFDLRTKTNISASDSENAFQYSEDILIGGDYLLYLIEELDIEDEIQRMIKANVWEAMKGISVSTSEGLRTWRASEDTFEEYFVLKEGSGHIWVIDNFYVDVIKPIDEQALKKKLDTVRPSYVSSHLSRLALLLAIRYDKDRIRNLVQQYLFVIPIGYRPKIDNRVDPLTKEYNKVVKRNNELALAMECSGAKLNNVRLKYKALVEAVKSCTLVNLDKYDNEKLVPISETFKGKEGHIRDQMQGVRSDYTGRTVITVDPEMSVDTVGIPMSMLPKLLEPEIAKRAKSVDGNKCSIFERNMTYQREKIAREVLKSPETVVALGRQPTLYQLSTQAFIPTEVDGDAIVLNPLITPPFNADFDGDMMHSIFPQTERGKSEVRNLMLSTKNLFLPRNGECHVAPRHEMIYGLWKASVAKIDETSEYGFEGRNIDGDNNALIEKVCSQGLLITDRAIIDGREESVGVAVIRAALTRDFNGYRLGVLPLTKDPNKKEKGVSEKWFKEVIKQIAIADKSEGKKKWVSIVNKLVKLGFALANIYPPNISVLEYPDVSDLIAEFDQRISNREELYNRGFETEESFSLYYAEEYSDLAKKITERLREEISKTDSGFIDMVDAKAHASESNILQLFGMKGQVAKNEEEAFNAIIRHSLVQQLTGLEHYVTTYGSRKGVIDKVIKTYEPGYLSRLMSHSASIISITNEDCGTTEGFELDYDFLLQFIPRKDRTDALNVNDALVRELFCNMVLGRYLVGIDSEIQTKSDAENIYNRYVSPVKSKRDRKSVLLRSPLTCKNPCCVKCYGKDLGVQAEVVVGTPVGYIASQSIGEPGTQLIMKNFQSGGVAGVTNLTSSFTILNNYLGLFDSKSKAKQNTGGAISYDYISPFEGRVKTVSQGNGTKRLYIMGEGANGKEKNMMGNSKIFVYEGIELKPYVKVGESIQAEQGDLDIKELIKYRGADYAQKYLVMFIYNLFRQQVDVNLKHFEVLVAGMTMQLCLKGNGYFRTGCYYTLPEYYKGDKTGCEFYKTIKGVKEVPLFRTDFFSNIFLENITKGISRGIIMSGYDSLTYPMTRTAFGLTSGIGSDVPGYVEKRGK